MLNVKKYVQKYVRDRLSKSDSEPKQPHIPKVRKVHQRVKENITVKHPVSEDLMAALNSHQPHSIIICKKKIAKKLKNFYDRYFFHRVHQIECSGDFCPEQIGSCGDDCVPI